ncbi:MAG: MBOAT family protein [Erysipelotrichaceae bacterium]|nr:MBOAT family protein [Erysipelotrichaceae bacterium]
MLFTSYQFVIFVALLFVIYYRVNKEHQWIVLLLGSYLFYAYSGIFNLVYFLTTTVSTYFLSKHVQSLRTQQNDYIKEHKKEMGRDEKKAYRKKMKGKQWRTLLLALLFNFGVLGVVKYTNFMIGNYNGIMHLMGKSGTISFMDIALPMGISFYTFQSMGYMIDVYRGTVDAENNIFKLALFISFFPQVIQGPISRFKDLSETLFAEHDWNLKQITFGLERVLWGFCKKMIVADRILVAVNTIIHAPEQYDGFYVFLGMIFYAIELYADFTGGIDITIGLAQMFGVRLTENFDRPYFSKNIAEYWRRWHITMGTWFRDYVFYPLSVSPRMLKFSNWCRKKFPGNLGKRIPVYVSSFIVWFCTGLWHGASWNFIVWGLLNAAFITGSEEFKPLYKKFHTRFKVAGKWYYEGFQMLRTFLLMSSLRTLDCYRNVPLTFKMYGTMFTKFNIGEVLSTGIMKLGLSGADYMVVVIGVALMIGVSILKGKGDVRDQIEARSKVLKYVFIYVMAFAIIIFGAYGMGFDASQFIYNQF